jgi:predicted transcriptional regulator
MNKQEALIDYLSKHGPLDGQTLADAVGRSYDIVSRTMRVLKYNKRHGVIQVSRIRVGMRNICVWDVKPELYVRLTKQDRIRLALPKTGIRTVWQPCSPYLIQE